MDNWFEALIIDRTSIISLLSFTSGMELVVRQSGEQLPFEPSTVRIVDRSPRMSRDALDRWIRDYKRGYTDYEKYVKSQISRTDWRVLKRLRVNLNSWTLAQLWTDFVEFPKRTRLETPFLLEQLADYTHPKVFDACLGSGATTIGLKKAGIDTIVSNEIDPDLIEVAREEAGRNDVTLNLTNHDWRNLASQYEEEFDAVLCLGNSLTYLFKTEDQLRALDNFRRILKPNGKLIIDERNYPHHFLGNNYRFSGNFIYCGNEKVSAHPIHISETMIVMEYQHKRTGEKAHLVLYPFKENEMRQLIRQAGWKELKAFGDYQPDFKPEAPEFITYVARKRPQLAERL